MAGDGAGELVVVEIKLRQLGQVAQLGGDGAGELVEGELQVRQLGQTAQLAGDGAGELVVAEPKRRQRCQATQLAGDGAGESGSLAGGIVVVVVAAEIQLRQLGQAAQFFGDGTAEAVVAEIQLRHLGQAAQFFGDGAGEAVFVESKLRQAGQVAQCRRDGAGECRRRTPLDFQLGHPGRSALDGDTVPRVHIERCRPIQSPRAAQRVLEAQQSGAVSGQGRPPVVYRGAVLGTGLGGHGRRAAHEQRPQQDAAQDARQAAPRPYKRSGKAHNYLTLLRFCGGGGG